MKKLAVVCLCVLAIVFSTTIAAFALVIAPVPREIDLGDELVFWIVLPEDEVRGYPQAGLYRDGVLVYSVDVNHGWWWEAVYFSNDAMTFLRVPSMPGTIRFYERGVFVHGHDTISLLQGGEDALVMPEPGSTFTYATWDFGRQRYYNRENNLLRITTVENTIISFDLSTGLILSIEEPEEPPVQRNYHIAFIGIGAGICVVALIIMLKRRPIK